MYHNESGRCFYLQRQSRSTSYVEIFSHWVLQFWFNTALWCFFFSFFYHDSFVLRSDKYNTYKTKGRHPVSFPLQRQNQEAHHSPEMSADDNKLMLKMIGWIKQYLIHPIILIINLINMPINSGVYKMTSSELEVAPEWPLILLDHRANKENVVTWQMIGFLCLHSMSCHLMPSL